MNGWMGACNVHGLDVHVCIKEFYLVVSISRRQGVNSVMRKRECKAIIISRASVFRFGPWRVEQSLCVQNRYG